MTSARLPSADDAYVIRDEHHAVVAVTSPGCPWITANGFLLQLAEEAGVDPVRYTIERQAVPA